MAASFALPASHCHQASGLGRPHWHRLGRSGYESLTQLPSTHVDDQHRSTVIALGLESRAARKDFAARIRTVSEAYGLPLDPRHVVHVLSAEIANLTRARSARAGARNP
ncbi:hypothetical protein [Desertibaculum subflavum]|uniref:hypothetical protein n=1 Tax=Desertibaculum subflavum TaxID=2268458 RepID=UPI0013C40906